MPRYISSLLDSLTITTLAENTYLIFMIDILFSPHNDLDKPEGPGSSFSSSEYCITLIPTVYTEDIFSDLAESHLFSWCKEYMQEEEVQWRGRASYPEFPSMILYKTAPINDEEIPYNFRDCSLYNPQSPDASTTNKIRFRERSREGLLARKDTDMDSAQARGPAFSRRTCHNRCREHV